MLYAGLIAVVLGIMGLGLMNKTVLETNVLRDRNPLFIQLSDGGVRNRYTVKILNKRYEPRTFQVAAQGLPGAQMEIIGFEGTPSPDIEVPASDLRELQVHVTVPAGQLDALERGATPFEFVINDTQADSSNSVTTTFRRPE